MYKGQSILHTNLFFLPGYFIYNAVRICINGTGIYYTELYFRCQATSIEFLLLPKNNNF